MNFKKIFLFGILLFFLASCQKTEESKPLVVELPEQYNSTLDEEVKANLAIERIKEITSIRKGDYMISKNNPKEALDYYLPVLEKLPEDVILYRKIAEAYFMLKDWQNAYLHFVHVPLDELGDENQKNMIFSLFYDENFLSKKEELLKFSFTDEQKDYYNAISECYTSLENCIDFLTKYEGKESRILGLQKITQDYKKISPSEEYRDLLLAKQFYEQKMYRLVGMITSSILANNPGYLEAIKMRAFSLYELGKYSESIDLMLKYYEKNSSDMEVIIRLGEAYTNVGEYTTANLYLNNAILAGYERKTLLERRLAYNYYKIGDLTGMSKVLSYLLQEKDVSEDDYAVAISLAQKMGDNTKAYVWSFQAINKFPGSKVLIPLYVQSLRLIGKNQESEKFLSKMSDEILALPMIKLEKAILLYQKESFDEAKKIFEELASFASVTDFSIEAENYLNLIKQKEKTKKEEEKSLEKSFWDN